MDVTISKEAKENEEIYLKYRTGDRQSYASQIVDDRAFALGAQLTQEASNALEANNQYTGSVNEVTPSIDLVVAMLCERNPRWQFSGAEKSDAKIAADIADLHFHIWDVSNGTQILEKHVYDFEEAGMGVFMAYSDPYADLGKGEIKITDLDPLDVYIDPKSKKPDSSDAENILIVKNLTKGQVKNILPNFSFEGAQAIGDSEYPGTDRALNEDQVLNSSEEQELKYRCIDRYSKIKVKRFHVYDSIAQWEKIFDKEDYDKFIRKPAFIIVKQNEESYESRDFRVQQLQNLYESTGGIFHYVINPYTQETELRSGFPREQGAIPATLTQLKPTIMYELIQMGVIKVSNPMITRVKRVYTIGNKVVANDVLPMEDYPIVTSMLHHKRNPYPMSDIRLVKPLQEQLNKIMSLILAYNTNITNVKYFVPKGSGTKKELEERGGKAGSQVFEYDPELGGQPIIVQLTQMSQALYEEKRQIQDQIQRIIGAYAVMDGQSAQAPQTKGGTVLIDEYGQRRISLKRRRIESSLNQLAKAVSQMIPNVYTEEKVVRIIEPNKKIKETSFNQPDPESADRIINDLSIRYDVRIVSGSTMPTNKMQRHEMVMNAYLNRVITDPSIVIEYMDLPDTEEIKERENRLRQYEQRIAQLEEELKKTSGALQRKSNEVIQANEKTKIEKFGAELDKIKNKVESAVELGNARMQDAIKESKKPKEKGSK